MKAYKRFALGFASLLALYIIFNFVVWHLCTKALIASRFSNGGDLTAIGYISGSQYRRVGCDDLPRRHIERNAYQGGPVDVVTLGDSFSNGAAHGRNSYYQDYLASVNGFTVLNLPPFPDLDKISTISLLLNSGYLGRLKPRFVVIECSEKLCLSDLPERYDFDKTISQEELDRHPILDYHKVPSPSRNLIDLEFLSQANFKLIRNRVLYSFSDHAFFSPAYQARLDRPFFSVENPEALIYLDLELSVGRRATPEHLAMLNSGLNTLADRLAAQGIRLYFMPAVDKYDLYCRYIVKNRHAPSRFFEELRKLPKRYRFIDTKALLAEELEKGERDIFYADDTHWSWRASEKIFQNVKFAGALRGTLLDSK